MISYKEQLQAAAQFIRQNDHFLIVSHVHPDGDTISSSVAMAHILKSLGKSFQLVNEDSVPDKFLFLPWAKSIQTIPNINRKFSYVITLDVADKNRAGEINHLLDEQVSLLNIDHHPTNDLFGNVNVVLPTAAATAEVMYDLIKEMNISLNKDIATCIYTGLLTDTGGFRYANTSSKVMRIAAELLEYEISPGNIAEIALETITINHIEVLKRAFEHVELHGNGFIAWTVLSHSDLLKAAEDDTEGIVNYMRNLEGVEVGVFFKETKDNEYKVSLRSKKHIDVGSIAKSFGGGGHARAAGFTYHGPLEQVQSELLTKIEDSKGWNQIGK